MLSVVIDEPTGGHILPSVLDAIVREGARRMLAAALEAEVDGYIEAHVDERDERGKRLVVLGISPSGGRVVMTLAGTAVPTRGARRR